LAGELVPRMGYAEDSGAIHFPLGRDGHFHIEGRVNGEPVAFLVDTGASSIVLTPEAARRAGFVVEQLAYTQWSETANGRIRGAPVRLNALAIGTLVLHDVAATVNPVAMDESLLGMRFFNQLKGGYQVRNGLLTLFWE
jgi:aspartyl protease family protein